MKKLLEEEYKKLLSAELTPNGKVNILNNIVQFKISETEFVDCKNDLSIDIKRYLDALIELAEKGARNYDIINENQLRELLNNFSHQEKIAYLDYFIRILEKSAFKDDIKKLQKLKYITIVKYNLKTIWKPTSVFKILIHFPLYNIITLSVTLIIIGLIANIVLLPAPLKIMQIINVRLELLPISNNIVVNHFINVSANLIGVNSEFKIIPLDTKSMIVLMLGKIFMFSYVATLIFNKLTDLIKR